MLSRIRWVQRSQECCRRELSNLWHPETQKGKGSPGLSLLAELITRLKFREINQTNDVW